MVVAVGYVFSSTSPYIAIRKHLFIIDPVQAVACIIQPTAIADFGKGRPFIVNGFVEDPSEYKINIVYVKRNDIGLYYVYSIEDSL